MGKSHLASEGTAAVRQRQFILETRLNIRDLGSVLKIWTFGFQSQIGSSWIPESFNS
jgi:hypothetical protein